MAILSGKTIKKVVKRVKSALDSDEEKAKKLAEELAKKKAEELAKKKAKAEKSGASAPAEKSGKYVTVKGVAKKVKAARQAEQDYESGASSTKPADKKPVKKKSSKKSSEPKKPVSTKLVKKYGSKPVKVVKKTGRYGAVQDIAKKTGTVVSKHKSALSSYGKESY